MKQVLRRGAIHPMGLVTQFGFVVGNTDQAVEKSLKCHHGVVLVLIDVYRHSGRRGIVDACRGLNSGQRSRLQLVAAAEQEMGVTVASGRLKMI